MSTNEKAGYYQIRDYGNTNIIALSPKELDIFIEVIYKIADKRHLKDSFAQEGAKTLLINTLNSYKELCLDQYEEMKKENFEWIYQEVQNLKYVIILLDKFKDISEWLAERVLTNVSRNKALFSVFTYMNIEFNGYPFSAERDTFVKKLIDEIEDIISNDFKISEVVTQSNEDYNDNLLVASGLH